jgi:hypothetical protein
VRQNDFIAFAGEMAALAETFGNQAPSENKIEIYFRALSDLAIEQIREAVSNLLNRRTITSTFPVPAEIREAIGIRVEDAALIALDKLEKAIERYGLYRTVKFDDKIIHMVIRAMGGWVKVCRNDSEEGEDWTWRRKEFLKLYQVFARNPRAEYPEMLVGLAGEEDAGEPKVYLIGEEKKQPEVKHVRPQDVGSGGRTESPRAKRDREAREERKRIIASRAGSGIPSTVHSSGIDRAGTGDMDRKIIDSTCVEIKAPG